MVNNMHCVNGAILDIYTIHGGCISEKCACLGGVVHIIMVCLCILVVLFRDTCTEAIKVRLDGVESLE